MKRKLFNPGLYLDSLRRTALVGGLFTVILCVQTLLLIFGYRISISDYMLQQDMDIQAQTVGMFNMNPGVLAVPLLMVPILMMTLFGFLNKRSTSDFWHSTPFSRQCLFITFTLAALSWAVVAMIVSTGVSVLGFLMMPKLFAINFASVFSVFISTLAMCFLVAAVFTVSMSVTGTALNNIVVACLILFLPRAMMLFYGAITSNSVLFENYSREGFAAGDLNLVFGLCGGFMFADTDLNEMMSSFASIGYTFGLSIVYLALGMLLFNRRKSEAAAYSAVNRHLQTAFRVIVAFIVCLIPIFMIVDAWNSAYSLGIEEWFVCAVLYVIALIAYFIYELITTRKAKNMLKAIPSLGILAVLNVAVILLAHNTYNIEYNYTPTPETVSSVRIGIDGYVYSGEKNYFETMMSKTDIQDEEFEKLLCELYSDTRISYEKDTIWNYYDQRVTVGFKSGSKYRYRNIYIDSESYSEIGQLMEKNQAIKDIYDIQKMFDNTVHYDIFINSNYGEISDTERERLKEAYIEDIKALSFEDWYMIASQPYNSEFVNQNGETESYFHMGNFYLSINENATSYSVVLPVTNMMPKTYDLVLEKVFEYQQKENSQQKMLSFINDEDNFEYGNPNVWLYNAKKLSEGEHHNLESAKKIKKLVDALTPCLSQVPDHNSRIAVLSGTFENADREPEYMEVYFKVPDDADLTFLLGDEQIVGDESYIDGAKQEVSSQTDSTSSAQ